MSYRVSKKFWQNIERYPNYPHLLKRRFLDISFVLGFIGNAKSILDIGCGDGSLLILLRELSSIEKFYGLDISGTLLKKARYRWGEEEGLELRSVDLTEDLEFPQTDVTVCMGAFPYIFEIEDLRNILYSIKSKVFLTRIPCTMKDKDEYINKFSEDLKANYSAVYRTVGLYNEMLSNLFKVESIERSYPDEIESKYETKHFFFVCERS
jgi:SAM-dependent methyltransferase